MSKSLVCARPALSRRSVFEAKDESRKQAAAADKAREAAVEEAVSRVNRQVEEGMSENYRYLSLQYQRLVMFCSTLPGSPFKVSLVVLTRILENGVAGG